VEQLGAGWHHNFTLASDPPHPGGMGFVQTIRVRNDGPYTDKECSTCPTWFTLRNLLAANPGSLWFIGNEQDRQDWVPASRYAEIYHALYRFIKTQDPSSQVGVGGVVQSTPLRLEYLDRIYQAYSDKYGSPLPVDVWNTHNYVLRESATWGAGIPPGLDALAPTLAILYDIEDHDLLNRHPADPKKIGWKQQIVLMRQWMADHGYRDRPLFVSEYGILMPDHPSYPDYDYDYEVVSSFMLATFDWMLSSTDPHIGLPADDNRLVQAWAWYSLDEQLEHFPQAITWYHLFDPETKTISLLGRDFAAYTAGLGGPSVDLKPTSLGPTPLPGVGGITDSVTVTLKITNLGADAATNVKVRFESPVLPDRTVTIPSVSPGVQETVSVTWSGLVWGQRYALTATVDSDGKYTECDESNNSLASSILMAEVRLYLPLLHRGWYW
jgi:hypothetical protein